MVLVFVAGGGLGWVIHRAKAQRDAARAISRVGVDVGYSWQRIARSNTFRKAGSEEGGNRPRT